MSGVSGVSGVADQLPAVSMSAGAETVVDGMRRVLAETVDVIEVVVVADAVGPRCAFAWKRVVVRNDNCLGGGGGGISGVSAKLQCFALPGLIFVVFASGVVAALNECLSAGAVPAPNISVVGTDEMVNIEPDNEDGTFKESGATDGENVTIALVMCMFLALPLLLPPLALPSFSSKWSAP